MRKYIIMLGAAFLSLIWVQNVAPTIGLGVVNPILIVGVFLFLRNLRVLSLIWALIAGLLLDFYSSAPFGTHMTALLTALLCVEIVLQYYDQRDVIRLLLASFVATTIYYLLHWALVNTVAFFSSSTVIPLSKNDLTVIMFEVLVSTIAITLMRAYYTRVLKRTKLELHS